MKLAGKIGAAAVGAILAGVISIAAAQASPGSSPHSDIIDLDCQQLGTLQVVVSNTSDNANEDAPAWGVGHVVGTNMVLIPFSFDFEGTFTPIGGEPEPFSFSL